jgi:hypothetical protein
LVLPFYLENSIGFATGFKIVINFSVESSYYLLKAIEGKRVDTPHGSFGLLVFPRYSRYSGGKFVKKQISD